MCVLNIHLVNINTPSPCKDATASVCVVPQVFFFFMLIQDDMNFCSASVSQICTVKLVQANMSEAIEILKLILL